MESIDIDADIDSPEKLEILGGALDETQAEVRQKHENGELSDAELEAAEARLDEIRDEQDKIRAGMDGEGGEARTNVATTMPSGEWADHDGPTDEWGTDMRGKVSHERLNRLTDRVAVRVHGMLSADEWTGHTAINHNIDQPRPDVNTAIVKLGDNDLIETDYGVHPPQYRLTDADADVEAALDGDDGGRANMAGVPQDIERDASGIGELDLSDVPSGEWDADTARLNRRIPTDTDNADEMPSGEWPTPGGERLNSDRPKSAVFDRLSATEWMSREDIASPNDRLGTSDYERALTHLQNDGRVERNDNGEYRILA